MTNEEILIKALEKIIQMNVQYCIDRYGDGAEAENMSCVKVARQAIAQVNNNNINDLILQRGQRAPTVSATTRTAG